MSLSRYTVYIGIGLIFAYCVLSAWIQKRNRNQAYKAVNRSIGTFDSHAQSALKRFQKLQFPQSRDHFQMARLVDLNVNQGNINNIRTFNSVLDSYSVPLENGPSWFEIDQMENFIERHRDLVKNNPHYEQFLDSVLQAGPEKVKKSLASFAEDLPKLEAHKAFSVSNLEYEHDAQNSHDSAVNHALRQTLKSICSTTDLRKPPLMCFKEVSNAIASSTRPKVDKERMKTAFSKMRENSYNSTLDMSEGDLIVLLWNRASNKANQTAGRQTLVENAILDAFCDMSQSPEMSNGTEEAIVCPNGRCARLLESLLYTDSDQNAVTGAMTLSLIRNDCIKQAHRILQESIDQIEGFSLDEGMIQVAKHYSDGTVDDIDPLQEAKFKAIICDKIANYIAYNYRSKVTPRQLKSLTDHCVEAIESL